MEGTDFNEFLPAAVARDNSEEGEQRRKEYVWDKLMPEKYFWVRQTMALSTLCIYALQLMFPPMCRYMMVNFDPKDPWRVFFSLLMGCVVMAMHWSLWRCMHDG